MPRIYDHIDLRVPSLPAVTAFYEALLPALGFTRRMEIEEWLQFEAVGEGMGSFFGVTESVAHIPNENRIAFWAKSTEVVDHLAEVAMQAGARMVEGPLIHATGYYAVFFEDPCGNRFEVCHRTPESNA